MGRSLRRVKRRKPKIIKRKHKKSHTKSKIPTIIEHQGHILTNKLDTECVLFARRASIKPKETTCMPCHLALHLSSFAYFLCRVTWDQSTHIKDNYKNTGFVMDPNEGRGRKTEGGLSNKVEKKDEDLDTDLKKTLSIKNKDDEKVAPKRPTDRQRATVAQLQKFHGDDIEAMVKDHKRNKMQLSAAKLKTLIEACEFWARGSGVDFRTPAKGLWTAGS